MKKALVWNESLEESGLNITKEVGYIEIIAKASYVESWTNAYRTFMDIVDVPVELEDKESHVLEAIQVDGEWVIQEKSQ